MHVILPGRVEVAPQLCCHVREYTVLHVVKAAPLLPAGVMKPQCLICCHTLHHVKREDPSRFYVRRCILLNEFFCTKNKHIISFLWVRALTLS